MELLKLFRVMSKKIGVPAHRSASAHGGVTNRIDFN
jgi:hypothetical protein